jgi:hypothetical protein
MIQSYNEKTGWILPSDQGHHCIHLIVRQQTGIILAKK